MSSGMQGGRDVLLGPQSDIRIERMKEEYDFSKEKKGSSLPLTLINFEQGSTVDLTTFLF